jgi:SAM-dependent methyltransferase
VINLSPDKPAVFREALRVLRPGGRIAISDLVASSPLPDAIKNDPSAFAGCMSGAPGIDELRSMLAQAGFTEIEIAVDPKSRSFIRDWLPGSGVETFISSARIRAQRPSGDGCCATAPSSGCC